MGSKKSKKKGSKNEAKNHQKGKKKQVRIGKPSKMGFETKKWAFETPKWACKNPKWRNMKIFVPKKGPILTLRDQKKGGQFGR